MTRFRLITILFFLEDYLMIWDNAHNIMRKVIMKHSPYVFFSLFFNTHKTEVSLKEKDLVNTSRIWGDFYFISYAFWVFLNFLQWTCILHQKKRLGFIFGFVPEEVFYICCVFMSHWRWIGIGIEGENARRENVRGVSLTSPTTQAIGTCWWLWGVASPNWSQK